MAVAVLDPGWGDSPTSFATDPPSLLATDDFFAKITQTSDFFAFPNCRKVSKFAASIEHPKTESASASGGLCP